jgi:hypothetical protein
LQVKDATGGAASSAETDADNGWSGGDTMGLHTCVKLSFTYGTVHSVKNKRLAVMNQDPMSFLETLPGSRNLERRNTLILLRVYRSIGMLIGSYVGKL